MGPGGFGNFPSRRDGHKAGPELGVVKRNIPQGRPVGPKLGKMPPPAKPVTPMPASGPQSFAKILGAPQTPKPTSYKQRPDPLPPSDFHVIILSANPNNLELCLDSLIRNEPQLPAGRVIVVDDGARSGVEGYFSGVHWIQGLKPFIFARNANLGMQWAGTDVILLNDDALLITPNGFTRMSKVVRERHAMGICSAAIKGEVGNPNQLGKPGSEVRPEPQKLSFMCVYITRHAIERIGYLDEGFVDYGWEDDDFCLRALRDGMGLGIYDGCLVDHSREEASSFRTKSNIAELITNNRLRFEKKWQGYV